MSGKWVSYIQGIENRSDEIRIETTGDSQLFIFPDGAIVRLWPFVPPRGQVLLGEIPKWMLTMMQTPTPNPNGFTFNEEYVLRTLNLK